MTSTQWDEVWRYETPRFLILAEVTPEEEHPGDLFNDQAAIDDILEGRVAWFQARVRVLTKDEDGRADEELGSDYLGGCAYEHPIDLFRDHAGGLREKIRDLRQNITNYHKHAKYCLSKRLPAHWQEGYSQRSIQNDLGGAAEARKELARLLPYLRKADRGETPYGYYGPSMVREAIAEARRTLARQAALAKTMRQESVG